MERGGDDCDCDCNRVELLCSMSPSSPSTTDDDASSKPEAREDSTVVKPGLADVFLAGPALGAAEGELLLFVPFFPPLPPSV
jgi:hypothetical protein